MLLNNFNLLTDGIGLVYLPDNSALMREYRKLIQENDSEGREILMLFDQFSEAGWIESYKKFNSEGEGFYAFKTKKIRVYGLCIKSQKHNFFIISYIFIKQNKAKEHNQAIEVSKKRLKEYESNIQRIHDYQG